HTEITPSSSATLRRHRLGVRPLSLLLGALVASATATAPASAAGHIVTGPSSSAAPYVLPTAAGVRTVSILTVGDTVDGYRMVGIPDGLGAFDNGDGTFTLLMNHELGATAGVERRHGAAGAFVSRWTITADPEGPAVLGGQDLAKTVHAWDNVSGGYVAATGEANAFGRLCSADLPGRTAFYDPASQTGWNGTRIFMDGEEIDEGRAFAHLLNGKSYELARLGRLSWENSVASPASGVATVVVGLDDSTPGQVYVYVGQKTNAGSPIDRAGLTNGSLYGVSVAETVDEATAADPLGADDASAFSLAALGDVTGWSADDLQDASEDAGVTEFLRPEDGAWDPEHPNDFYFVTTASFSGPSRLWRLRFADATNPSAGGTIQLLLEGAEGQRMMDNLTIDRSGHVLVQEDPGNQAHVAKI
ncbi:MAG: DUF839 domain-containing protein, partial [Chloroflexi bacterium]|nr:DUF839 domain-containing protein [Chloroflexota bacterium]